MITGRNEVFDELLVDLNFETGNFINNGEITRESDDYVEVSTMNTKKEREYLQLFQAKIVEHLDNQIRAKEFDSRYKDYTYRNWITEGLIYDKDDYEDLANSLAGNLQGEVRKLIDPIMEEWIDFSDIISSEFLTNNQSNNVDNSLWIDGLQLFENERPLIEDPTYPIDNIFSGSGTSVQNFFDDFWEAWVRMTSWRRKNRRHFNKGMKPMVLIPNQYTQSFKTLFESPAIDPSAPSVINTIKGFFEIKINWNTDDDSWYLINKSAKLKPLRWMERMTPKWIIDGADDDLKNNVVYYTKAKYDMRIQNPTAICKIEL
jgi:hypothetical protein